MTKFNPLNKDRLTHGECLDPAMRITDKEDAAQYKRDYIAFVQRRLDEKPNSEGLTAEQIVNQNLGYYAGYGDDKLRERVEELFECSHPVFGAIKDNGTPTAEKALAAGLDLRQYIVDQRIEKKATSTEGGNGNA